MRIDRLDLVAFGSFTDTSLDLGSPGLHVVYGPNEAGKTTARAAVANLLFGFERRTSFAFAHPANRLQIGARLQTDDMGALDVVRHKRDKEPLVEAGTRRAVTPSTWSAFLHGTTRGEYEAMYTLGWKELIEGTAALVARGGALGEALFAAGLGVRALGPVLEKLTEEASALYGVRAPTRTVNAALRAAAEARRRSGELAVKPARYVDVHMAHERACQHRAEAVARQRRLEVEHERLVTLRGALPTLRERRIKIAERARLLEAGPVPPASWAERVQQALDERREVTRRRSSSVEQVHAASRALEAVAVDEALLVVADRVDVLAEGIAGYLQATSDRAGLEVGRRDAERDALALLGEIAGPAHVVAGLDAGLDAARSALAARDQAAQSRDDWTMTESALDRARDDLDRLDAERGGLGDVLALLPEVPDPMAIRDAVAATMRHGDLDAALESTTAALREIHQRRKETGGRLGLSEPEITGVVAQPSPSHDEVEAILAALGESAAAASVAAERARAGGQREAELVAALDVLEGPGALPSPAQLADRREHRDATWSLVKAAWLEGAVPTGEGTPYADAPALAATYERLVDVADSTVDQLWQEADRTAQRHSLTAELERVRASRRDALAEVARAEAHAASSYAAWCDGWPRQALPAPAALRQWAANLDRLRSLHDAWMAARREHRSTYRSVRAHRSRLAQLLRAHGLEVVPGTDLSPVVARAQVFCAEQEQCRKERAEAERRLQTVERDLPTARRRVEAATAAEGEAADRFRALVAPFGDRVSSARQAGWLLDRLGELERLLDARSVRMQRVAGIDQRCAAFATELGGLVTLAPDLATNPPVDAARTLVRRVKLARDADAARVAHRTTLADAQQMVDAADAELAGLDAELELLAAEADVADLERLEAMAARAARMAALEAEVVASDALLAAQGGGRDVTALEADADGRDLAEIGSAIDEMKERLARLDGEVDEATRAETELSRDLASMDGSDGAAAEAGRAQQELSRAVEGAERYVRLVLARHIADEAIRRYSAAHRDPLLDRASAYLSTLTGGRCPEVTVDEDPTSGPRLAARYAEGDERAVPELSEGTRDQLYLALRLAAIEEACAGSGPMPVVLDDVLVNFDDDRVTSALRCLARLAASCQVLLFTHHRHVVALAAAALNPAELALHELDAPGRR